MSASRNKKSKSSKTSKPSKPSKSSKSSTTKSKPKQSPKHKKKQSKPESTTKSKPKPKSKSKPKPQQNNTKTEQENIWGVKLKKNKKNVHIESKYKLGDFVLLGNDREGIIGYKGPLHNNPKTMIFYGIELLNGSIGDTDGTYKGKRYFQTLPNRSIFVTVDEIRRTMVGKDYNTPKRLDRRQSLQHKQHSSVGNKKQTAFELAIYDVAKEMESKCDKLEELNVSSVVIPKDNINLMNKSQSMEQNNNESKIDLSVKNVNKKIGRKRGRKKGKAKSLALSEIRRKYEQNAKNIDNERKKLIDIHKKRKSFNKVKLDANVKSKAISGFKKKLKKSNEKEKMKEMFKNESEAVENSKSIIEELGFLKYLKDYEIYSHLFKSKINNKKHRKRRRKKGINKPGDDWSHKKAVSSIHTIRRDMEKKQQEKQANNVDNDKNNIVKKWEPQTRVRANTKPQNKSSNNNIKNKSPNNNIKNKSPNNKSPNNNIKNKSPNNIANKFANLNIDPSKLKVGAGPPRRVRNNGESRDIDHTVLMGKITIKGRRKKTRKKITFDDNGNGVMVVKNSGNVSVKKVNMSVKKVNMSVKSEEQKVDDVKEEVLSEVNDEKKDDGLNTGKKKMIRFAEEENKIGDIAEAYDVLDMTNTNIMLLLSETNANVLQNVICAAIQSIDTLQVLEMSNCGLDDKFLNKICDTLVDGNDMNGIWCLNFQSNPINDDGMLGLCKLIKANYKCLTHIKLQNNRKDISTSVCEEMCNSLQINQYIKVFEFEFRHYQYKDKCKKVLWRNNEAARKLKAKKKSEIIVCRYYYQLEML